MIHRVKFRGGFGLLCLVLAPVAVRPASASPITFANFAQQSTSPEPFSYIVNGTSATLSTESAGAPVYFSYQNGALLGVPLPSGLTGPLSAHLSLTATASTGGALDDYASQSPARRGAPTDNQPFDSLSASFTLDTPYNGLTNLLTLLVTPTGVGTPMQDNPTLSASDGQQSAALSVGTATLGVTFTSDFLNFDGTVVRDASLSFSAINPTGIKLDPGAKFLENFVADATGTFDSDPPPTTVNVADIPEPLTWPLLAGSLIGLGAVRRARPPGTATPAGSDARH